MDFVRNLLFPGHVIVFYKMADLLLDVGNRNPAYDFPFYRSSFMDFILLPRRLYPEPYYAVESRRCVCGCMEYAGIWLFYLRDGKNEWKQPFEPFFHCIFAFLSRSCQCYVQLGAPPLQIGRAHV